MSDSAQYLKNYVPVQCQSEKILESKQN